MIELQRHIEILLLENDCVIVPDFGGFVAHHVCASYDEQERMFLPPYRTLGFNALLRMNDSLLVHSYMAAYDISYPEAMRRIESEVEELKEELHNSGSYQLTDLGIMAVNADGNYEFIPSEAGILSPTFYGLNSLQIKKLHDAAELDGADAGSTTVAAIATIGDRHDTSEDHQATTEEASLLEFADAQDEDDNEKAISIKVSWIRNTVAIAAAAIALLLISTPIMNGDYNSLKMSHLNHHFLYKLIPQDTNVARATPVAKATEAIPAKATEAIPAKPAAATAESCMRAADEQPTATVSEQSAKPAVTYTIVLASQVKKSNAELFVEKLHKKGHTDAAVYIKDNVVRVVLGEYATQGEAYQRLNTLHNYDGFEEAWVYKKVEV